MGPPQKVRPAPLAGGNRARKCRAGKSEQPQFSAAPQHPQAIDWSASFFTVADGLTTLGHVLVGRREFRAFDAGDNPLGTFPTREAARAAIIMRARVGR